MISLLGNRASLVEPRFSKSAGSEAASVLPSLLFSPKSHTLLARSGSVVGGVSTARNRGSGRLQALRGPLDRIPPPSLKHSTQAQPNKPA